MSKMKEYTVITTVQFTEIVDGAGPAEMFEMALKCSRAAAMEGYFRNSFTGMDDVKILDHKVFVMDKE